MPYEIKLCSLPISFLEDLSEYLSLLIILKFNNILTKNEYFVE